MTHHGRSERRMIERKFARNMKKAGWYTFRDENTGRVVTNAYRHEVAKISKISGVECEILPCQDDVSIFRVSPVLQWDYVKIPANSPQSQQ